MERIGGFMQSHYMPPSGMCSRRIGPVDAMVIAVAAVRNTTQNTIFSQRLSYFLPSKAADFHNPKGTLYSRHQRNKLHKRVSKR